MGAIGGLGHRRTALTLRRAETMRRAGGEVDVPAMLLAAASAGGAAGCSAGVWNRDGGIVADASSPRQLRVMPPPPPRRPTVRFLSEQLGMSGPLGSAEARDRWSAVPSDAERSALNCLRLAADRDDRQHPHHTPIQPPNKTLGRITLHRRVNNDGASTIRICQTRNVVIGFARPRLRLRQIV